MTQNRRLQYLVVFSFFLLFSIAVRAQDAPPPPPPAPRAVYTVSASGSGAGYGVDEDDDDTKITGATVRGRIVYDDSGRPARFVKVMLSRGSDDYNRKFLSTDANGEFVFKNVKEGRYFAVVEGAGILEEKPRNNRARAEEKEGDTAREIAVSGLGELQMMVRIRRGGAVNGRITYADGEPAAGVRVHALLKTGERYMSPPAGRSDGSGVTDDRGIYRIAGLPAGAYVVRVVELGGHRQSKPEYDHDQRENQNAISRTYYPEGDRVKDAKELEIVLGGEENGVDIIIPERARFVMSGKIVRKRDGEPLDSFTISFTNLTTADPGVLDFGNSGRAPGSNKNGEWKLINLPKGKYRVTVSQGYARPSGDEKAPKPETYPSMTKEIEITDKDVTDAVFEIPTAASITGIVTVEGGKDLPDDLRIFVQDAETGEMKIDDYRFEPEDAKRTAKQQSFKISNLKEGNYTISAGAGEYFVKSVSGMTPSADSRIEVKEGDPVTGVRIVLSGEVGTVKGLVSGVDPADRLAVVLVKQGATVNQIQTGSKGADVKPGGEFEIKWAPGEYVIFLASLKKRPRNEAEAKEWITGLIRDGQRVTLRAGEVFTVNLTAPK